jgi:hypothetical protein
MTFLLVELHGRLEAGEIDAGDRALRRLVTPLAKLVTPKQAVAVTSEVIEGCGGAGYVEDTGLPQLLRDTQVLPIGEGTTNVLSLDALLPSGPHSALAVPRCSRVPVDLMREVGPELDGLLPGSGQASAAGGLRR